MHDAWLRLQKLQQLHMINAMHSNPKQLREDIVAELTNRDGADASFARDVAFFEAVERSVKAKMAAAS